MDQLPKFKKDPYGYIEDVSIKDLVRLIKIANDKYRNAQSIMNDDSYDLLIETLIEHSPNNPFLKQIGAPPQTKKKVKLPFYMGSMNKFKPTNINELNNWKKEYKSPYIISDKLDGVSALLVINQEGENKLYTRGDGKHGTDITELLKYININLDDLDDLEDMYIRGELIISKKNFGKYNDMANARNMVSGIVNAKKINPNIVKDVDFIAYEIIDPWIPLNKQFELLNKYKIKSVYNEQLDTINMEQLSILFDDRKNKSKYDIDGLIVSYNNPNVRSDNENPKYAFAFKETKDSAIVKVLDVEWNESKDGYLKPRLKLEPTSLSGVIITYVTAFNAKYVVDNNLGPGAEIKLIRSGDVIPHIAEVLKEGELEMPKTKYKWNESNVDIIIDKKSIQGVVTELTHFVKKLNIKNIDQGKIKKLVENGIDNIISIINISEDDLIDIEGFKDKTITNILDEIDTAINNMTLLDFMIASNIARGLGEKKLKKIIDITINGNNIIKEYYLNKINDDELYDYLYSIDGYDEKTCNLVIENIPKFIILLKDLPDNIRKKLLNYKTEVKSTLFDNMIIVFSGFRNKDWEVIIEKGGGKVSSSISNNTTLLVVKDGETNTSKILKANELNIQILDKSKFTKKYKLE